MLAQEKRKKARRPGKKVFLMENDFLRGPLVTSGPLKQNE
jgi:hypothetical protein